MDIQFEIKKSPLKPCKYVKIINENTTIDFGLCNEHDCKTLIKRLNDAIEYLEEDI